MALFKISKGVKANLPSTYTEGYCYFTTDDGKFYIDTTNTAAGRVLLNAGKADQLSTARTISLTGDVTGSATFDGSNNISIAATVANNSHNHSASNITSGTLAIARGGTGATTAADACKNLGALPTSGGTLTGSLTLANGTWNMVGNDVYIGDHNIAGAFCVKPVNTEKSSIVLYNTDETVMNTLTFDGTNPTWNGNYIYHQGNKPTYADVGAAAASHSHNAIYYGNTSNWYVAPAFGDATFGGVQVVGNGATLGYIYIKDNNLYTFNGSGGSQIRYHNESNLSFSLSGTTLYITKS